MKTHLIKTVILVIICLLTLNSYGQSKKMVLGKNMGKDFQFDVSETDSNAKSKSLLIIGYKKDQHIGNIEYNNLRAIDGLSIENQELVPSIVNSVLFNQIDKLKSQNAYLLVRLFPKNDGTLKHVEYIIPKDTDISVAELENISKQILEKVKVNFTEEVNDNIQIAPIIHNIRFNKKPLRIIRH